MTGLQRWRTLARGLVFASCAWEVLAAIVGIAALAAVASRTGEAPPAGLLVEVAGAVGIWGLILWAIRDAGRRGRDAAPAAGKPGDAPGRP